MTRSTIINHPAGEVETCMPVSIPEPPRDQVYQGVGYRVQWLGEWNSVRVTPGLTFIYVGTSFSDADNTARMIMNTVFSAEELLKMSEGK